jgi:hypothetical protein
MFLAAPSYGKKRKFKRKAFFVQGNTFQILYRGGDHNEVSMKRTAPNERGFHDTRTVSKT